MAPRSALRQLLRHPELRRLQRWGLVFVEFSLVQALVQLVGMITGIIALRLLVPEQYALYTIANSMLSALVVLADSGISTAAVGIGGRVWQDPIRLGQSTAAARKIMRTLRDVSGLPVAAFLVWLLSKNGAAPGEMIVLSCLVLIGAAWSLEASIFAVLARLLGKTRLIQWTAIGATSLRLLATVALGLIGLIAETAVLAVVIGYGVQYWASRRFMRGDFHLDKQSSPADREEFWGIVKRQLPNTLFFFFQGQLSVWLLSIFGTATAVADLGAVTRISVIFAVLLTSMQTIIIPAYARCQDPRRLPRLYLLISTGFAALVMLPVVLAAALPQPLLWILGSQYEHLPDELMLAVLSASLGSLTGLAWSLNANRAWFLPSWIIIPLELSAQVLLVLAIGASTVRQVLLVAIFTQMVQLAHHVTAAAVFIGRFRSRSRLATPR